jgi:hypothetical protein
MEGAMQHAPQPLWHSIFFIVIFHSTRSYYDICPGRDYTNNGEPARREGIMDPLSYLHRIVLQHPHLKYLLA